MTTEHPYSELIRFPLAEGGSVLIEVDERAGISRAGRSSTRVLQEARATFEQAVAGVRDAAAAALAQFTSMTRAPDEVELKFGLKMDAEAGAVIARTGVQGQFEVKLRWRRDGLPAEEETVEEP
ncbi:CU044_2847 family protein [Saccharothrix deserti]|uniref:CU044_2847 family protein n=1 Tax=Saccharothrix deserti TaxID=2593674 RepID=UPI00131D8779|nr:CU044_2847 family protein [Saccharothrix deserti]